MNDVVAMVKDVDPWVVEVEPMGACAGDVSAPAIKILKTVALYSGRMFI